MKPKLLKFSLAFLAVALLSTLNSCTIYEPQMVSIPLMSEKNEVQLSGGFSMLGGVSGSVAFAPAEHVALQVYGSAYPENTNIQASVGFYTRTNSDLNFEVYAGFGSGNGSEYADLTYTYSNPDYLLYFAQANFGQTNQGSAHIDYGFGIKAGVFEAHMKDNGMTNPKPYSTSAFLIEPQAFVRFGGEHFKVGFQMNGTKIFLQPDNALFNEFYIPYNMGLCLTYRFAPSIKRKY